MIVSKQYNHVLCKLTNAILLMYVNSVCLSGNKEDFTSGTNLYLQYRLYSLVEPK